MRTNWNDEPQSIALPRKTLRYPSSLLFSNLQSQRLVNVRDDRDRAFQPAHIDAGEDPMGWPDGAGIGLGIGHPNPQMILAGLQERCDVQSVGPPDQGPRRMAVHVDFRHGTHPAQVKNDSPAMI